MATVTVYVCTQCGHIQYDPGKCTECGAQTDAQQVIEIEKE